MSYQPAYYAADLSNTIQTSPGRVKLKNNQLTFAFDASPTEVRVKVDGVETSFYRLANDHTIELSYTWDVNDLPSAIEISRETARELRQFYPGASIRAEDLNNNSQKLLQMIEELSYQKK